MSLTPKYTIDNSEAVSLTPKYTIYNWVYVTHP